MIWLAVAVHHIAQTCFGMHIIIMCLRCEPRIRTRLNMRAQKFGTMRKCTCVCLPSSNNNRMQQKTSSIALLIFAWNTDACVILALFHQSNSHECFLISRTFFFPEWIQIEKGNGCFVLKEIALQKNHTFIPPINPTKTNQKPAHFDLQSMFCVSDQKLLENTFAYFEKLCWYFFLFAILQPEHVVSWILLNNIYQKQTHL